VPCDGVRAGRVHLLQQHHISARELRIRTQLLGGHVGLFRKLDVEGDDLELAALLRLVRIRVFPRITGTIGIQVVLRQLAARAAESETSHEGKDVPRVVQDRRYSAPCGIRRCDRAFLQLAPVLP